MIDYQHDNILQLRSTVGRFASRYDAMVWRGIRKEEVVSDEKVLTSVMGHNGLLQHMPSLSMYDRISRAGFSSIAPTFSLSTGSPNALFRMLGAYAKLAITSFEDPGRHVEVGERRLSATSTTGTAVMPYIFTEGRTALGLAQREQRQPPPSG